MGKIIKDNLIVDINSVRPNNYNPKLNYKSTNDNRVQFEKFKNSLIIHGQINPVKVRQTIDKDRYEIIDGYHIWTAMKELEFKEIEIKDFGNISREEAIKIFLCSEELKIPLDIVDTAKLVKEIKGLNIGLKGLPYTEIENENKIKLLEFDWSQFEEEIKDNKQLDLLGGIPEEPEENNNQELDFSE